MNEPEAARIPARGTTGHMQNNFACPALAATFSMQDTTLPCHVSSHIKGGCGAGAHVCCTMWHQNACSHPAISHALTRRPSLAVRQPPVLAAPHCLLQNTCTTGYQVHAMNDATPCQTWQHAIMTHGHCLLLGACTAGHARACSDATGIAHRANAIMTLAHCLLLGTCTKGHKEHAVMQHEHLSGQMQSWMQYEHLVKHYNLQS
eukprot:scaffold166070_cov20-Tisochrysis_lutea.AAC.1